MMSSCTGARSANAFTYNSLAEIPQVDTLTNEGIFNENFFEIEKQTDQLADLEFSMAQVINPLNGRTEQWIGILNKSKFDGIGLREPIDIVVALDISGSMGNNLNSNRGQSKSRFDLAKTGIFKLIDLLNPDDGFGFTIFEITAQSIIPLTPRKEISESHRQLIANTKKRGGTNLYNGLICAYETIKKSDKRSKRIMFVTDLEDKTFGKELFELFNQCAREGIFITIIGIGYESNAALAETLTHIKGGNYFLAQTEEELDKFLVHDFKYICFPSTFDHRIEFKSNNMTLNKCFGTGFNVPKIELRQNEWLTKSHRQNTEQFKSQVNFLLMYFNNVKRRLPIPVLSSFCNYLRYETRTFCKIDTSFPSHVTEKENKHYAEGGLILLRLTKEPTLLEYSCGFLMDYVSYEGKSETKAYIVKCPLFNSKDDFEFYSNSVIQNGLSLYYYSKLCRTIMKAENGTTTKENKEGYKKRIREQKDVLKTNVTSFIESNFNEKITNKKKREYINQLSSLVNCMHDNRVKRSPQQQQQQQKDDDIQIDELGRPYLLYYGTKAYLD